MPAYTSDLDEFSKRASAELLERRLNYSQWWDYYEGRQKKFLKTREGEPDYNVVVNLCARVVDQSVNFMVGTAPSFDLPGDSEDVQVAEALLQAWCDLNDWGEFLTDLMTTSAVCGHAFVKLIHEPELGNVRPVVLDPALVCVFWEATDKSRVRGYSIQWSDVVSGQVVAWREDHRQNQAGGWDVLTYVSNGQAGQWTLQGESVWPYPFPQVADWKNLPNPRGYYGRSDIERVISQNDAYNFRQSNTNKILYIHAHPRTVGIGVDKTEIAKTGIDGFFTIPEGASVQNLEMQSDLESSRKHADDTKADFFSDAQTVDLSTVKDKAGALTNFGLKLMFAEALAKNDKKRMLAGRGLAELARRVGVVLGFAWDGATVVWSDPLPANRVEQVANAKEEIAMGISSRQTQSERLGYDWEREEQRIAAEKSAQQAAMSEMLLSGLRDAGGGAGQDEDD